MRLLAVLAVFGSTAFAHDGFDHASEAEARLHERAVAALPPAGPLPFDLGGAFTLEASTGGTRTERDSEGRLQLLFFGYANCAQICSAALPLMGAVAERMEAEGHSLRPVMITVDPTRDTPSAMAATLPAIHPDFVGLTGSETALQAAYDAFSVERRTLFTDPFGQDIYAHGSFVYLLDADGDVLTLIPPILSADHAARIVSGYAAGL